MSRAIKVCIVPEYPVTLMHGGLQVQALELFEALNHLGPGISAELFDWSHGNPGANLYHFIGFPPYLSRVAELVAKLRRPYIVSVLLGSPQNQNRVRIAAFKRKLNLNPATRDQASAIQNAAALIAITPTDAKAIRNLYGASRPIHVIPHGVSHHFANATADVWRSKFGNDPFVLCVGAIQPRKNQLALANVCNGLQLPLVLLGPVLAGCEKYAEEVAAAMKQNTRFGGRWLTSLTNADPLLASAYAAARVFVLLSEMETQPISVLQAMAAKKPVMLLDAPYTREAPFQNSQRVESLKTDTIQKALKSTWGQSKPTALPKGYTWPEVAASLHQIYKKAITQ